MQATFQVHVVDSGRRLLLEWADSVAITMLFETQWCDQLVLVAAR
jgi:hypothetical protein